jgi:hypothetical protein
MRRDENEFEKSSLINRIGFTKAWIRNGIGIFRHAEINRYDQKARKISYACIKSHINKHIWTYLPTYCVNTLTCIIDD